VHRRKKKEEALLQEGESERLHSATGTWSSVIAANRSEVRLVTWQANASAPSLFALFDPRSWEIENAENAGSGQKERECIFISPSSISDEKILRFVDPGGDLDDHEQQTRTDS
jgi:hypothetical protein